MIVSKSEAAPLPFLRAAKAVLVAGVALLVTLVAFGNVTDYDTNFAFVQHVLRMDTTFPNAAIRHRAIDAPALHHAAYGLIIATEAASAALCWIGALRLARHLGDVGRGFERAKGPAVVGLTLGAVLWLVGFMAIAGEWFGMWMSPQWNGVPSAFRFLAITLGVLIFVSVPDPGLSND